MFPYMEEYRCLLCATRHSLRLCRRFLVLHPREKMRYVRQNKACVNCLGLSHCLEDCRSPEVCRVCWRRHHTLLHELDDSKYQWLQMTAQALVHRPGVDDEKHIVRILLSPNCSESYIAPPYQRLPFPTDYDIPDYELQFTDRHSEVRTLTIKLKTSHDGRLETPKAHCLPGEVWKKYDVEDVADTSFYLPWGCSIVLGKDVSKHIYLGLPQEQKGLPYMQNTIFGYAFFGALETDVDNTELVRTFMEQNTI